MEDEEPKHSPEKFHKSILKLESIYQHPFSKAGEINEQIRYISEALVWSEQNKYSFFNDFIFKNIQFRFAYLYNQSKSKDTLIQLIQSANILIHNLSTHEHKSMINLGYLLMTEFFYSLSLKELDFSDDEIVENYMSFLKGIAANLPNSLFLEYILHSSFRVFIKAFDFFTYPDPMIKNAARTVILTIIKCNNQLVNDSRIYKFLFEFQFTHKIMNNMTRLWEDFELAIPTKDKLLVENYVSSISDDLCYINDLLEHVEVMISDASNKFLEICMPWLINNLKKQSESQLLKFTASGFIIFSILEYIKSSYILNIIVTSLFSNKITEKFQCLMLSGSVPNNQFDFLVEDYGSIDNPVKKYIFSFLKAPENTSVVLLVLNNIISNPNIPKKVLFECQLLPKDELKAQMLLRRILQDNNEYSSDPNLMDFLRKILAGTYDITSILLAARMIYHCGYQPTEQHIFQLQAELIRDIRAIILNLQNFIHTESLLDLILDSFEEEFSSISSKKFKNKVAFPSDLLLNIDAKTSWQYRLPLTNKESYSWNFNKLFLLKSLEASIVPKSNCNNSNRNSWFKTKIVNALKKSPVIKLECINKEVTLNDFEICVVEKSSTEYKLRFVEVMHSAKDPCKLNLIFSQPKLNSSTKVTFANEECCIAAKKLIENKRKESKIKEIEVIKAYLQEELILLSSNEF